jgi:hypothetical protein
MDSMNDNMAPKIAGSSAGRAGDFTITITI